MNSFWDTSNRYAALVPSMTHVVRLQTYMDIACKLILNRHEYTWNSAHWTFSNNQSINLWSWLMSILLRFTASNYTFGIFKLLIKPHTWYITCNIMMKPVVKIYEDIQTIILNSILFTIVQSFQVTHKVRSLTFKP